VILVFVILLVRKKKHISRFYRVNICFREIFKLLIIPLENIQLDESFGTLLVPCIACIRWKILIKIENHPTLE
jgi:hypothetical protein